MLVVGISNALVTKAPERESVPLNLNRLSSNLQINDVFQAFFRVKLRSEGTNQHSNTSESLLDSAPLGPKISS